MTASGNGEHHPTLRFGSDEEPGIRRRGTKRFSYVDERTGKPVSSAAVLDRIKRLAVPPAWTDVWIAADRDSHLQATGRDARGRKQYRYHEVFTDDRANHKFADLVGFGSALGRFVGASIAICDSMTSVTIAWWRPSCDCSTPRACESAMRSTPAATDRSGSRRCATGTPSFAAARSTSSSAASRPTTST